MMITRIFSLMFRFFSRTVLNRRFLREIWGTLVAIFLAILIRTFVIQAFTIPSGSMIPSLLVGDYLFVTKYSYGYSRYALPFGLPLIPGLIFSRLPERGDIVVFRTPEDNDTYYIKRVIGLPSDTVALVDGRLEVNGVVYPRHFLHAEGITTVYKEDNGVVSYTIQQMAGYHDSDSMMVIHVPMGHVFVLGDNRNASKDSRYIGFIPLENIVGKARFIFFSLEGSWFEFWMLPFRLRYQRFFQGL